MSVLLSLVGQACMSSIIIRDFDSRLTARLQARAAQSGRSIEEEAQLILQDVLEDCEPANLAALASSLFGSDWGVELEEHPATQMRSIA